MAMHVRQSPVNAVLADSAPFIDEIWCETAEYDDSQRAIKYTHPETQPDDVLHAINYASTLARYIHDVTAFYIA